MDRPNQLNSRSMRYLTSSIRIRKTPFSKKVEASGAKAYTVYNHMLLPSYFNSIEEDYSHLKKAVQLWDVSCQRQVEIKGRDALHLLQLTTPRDLSRMDKDQCCYIPIVDDSGYILNDPIVIKLHDERYWVSLADSDMLYYFKGLASGFSLDVNLFEPDVYPLAIQGPKSKDLIEKVFGANIANTKFFRYKIIEFNERRMIICKTGWSHQSGFEIYLDGAGNGESLWDTLFDAGRDLDIRAGCPNLIERIEAGLLSYGTDINATHTPFEAGLGWCCDLDYNKQCLGVNALRLKQYPDRQIRPVAIDGPQIPGTDAYLSLEDSDGNHAGVISSVTWSPDFQINVAIGMINKSHWNAGTQLKLAIKDKLYSSTVQEQFWL